MDFTEFSLNIQRNNKWLVLSKFNMVTHINSVHVNVKAKSELSTTACLQDKNHFSQV